MLHDPDHYPDFTYDIDGLMAEFRNGTEIHARAAQDRYRPDNDQVDAYRDLVRRAQDDPGYTRFRLLGRHKRRRCGGLAKDGVRHALRMGCHFSDESWRPACAFMLKASRGTVDPENIEAFSLPPGGPVFDLHEKILELGLPDQLNPFMPDGTWKQDYFFPRP